jgi:hypothetical protein
MPLVPLLPLLLQLCVCAGCCLRHLLCTASVDLLRQAWRSSSSSSSSSSSCTVTVTAAVIIIKIAAVL